MVTLLICIFCLLVFFGLIGGKNSSDAVLDAATDMLGCCGCLVFMVIAGIIALVCMIVF